MPAFGGPEADPSIVAVGTTNMRLLESSAAETIEVRRYAGETRLFILPGD
jgi:S-adenosylmethionine:tRNA-ribosyltransferase-isomerase (queuine synthetase)